MAGAEVCAAAAAADVVVEMAGAGAGDRNAAAGLPKAKGADGSLEAEGRGVLATGPGMKGDADADGVLSPPGVDAFENERAAGKQEGNHFRR